MRLPNYVLIDRCRRQASDCRESLLLMLDTNNQHRVLKIKCALGCLAAFEDNLDRLLKNNVVKGQ